MKQFANELINTFLWFLVTILVFMTIFSFFIGWGWQTCMKAWFYLFILSIIVLLWSFFGNRCPKPWAPKYPSPWVFPAYMIVQMDGVIDDLKNLDLTKSENEGAEIKLTKLKGEIQANVTGLLKELNDARVAKYEKDFEDYKMKVSSYNECVKTQNEKLKIEVEQLKAQAQKDLASTNFQMAREGGKDFMAYVVLVFVIWLFVMFCVRQYRKSRAPPPQKEQRNRIETRKAATDNNSNIGDSIMSMFRYYYNMVTNMFTDNTLAKGFGRKRIWGGRCGDQWIDNGTTCLNTVSPLPYNTGRTDDETGNDVMVPFLIQESYFVPQCEKTFSYDENYKAKPTSVKYFKDNGLTCEQVNVGNE
jgi:hypothetical protein